MTIKILSLGLAAIAVGAVGFALQEPGKPPPAAAPIPQLSERIVHVYRADLLQGMTIKGAGDQEVGKLDALVIDASNGQLAYAVIEEGGMLGVGERQHLLPWAALHFRAKDDPQKNECEAVLLLTQEQVASCPTFKHGGSISADDERKAFESVKLPAPPNIERRPPGQLLCSLDVDGCRLECKGPTDIGIIEHVLVDPMEARVAYLVLDTDGTSGLARKHIAMPWQATRASLNKAQKLLLTTAQTKERVDAAPAYVDKDVKRMTSPAWLRELAAYYEVEPYWSSTTTAPGKPANPIQK